jgi:hypothetical protein
MFVAVFVMLAVLTTLSHAVSVGSEETFVLAVLTTLSHAVSVGSEETTVLIFILGSRSGRSRSANVALKLKVVVALADIERSDARSFHQGSSEGFTAIGGTGSVGALPLDNELARVYPSRAVPPSGLDDGAHGRGLAYGNRPGKWPKYFPFAFIIHENVFCDAERVVSIAEGHLFFGLFLDLLDDFLRFVEDIFQQTAGYGGASDKDDGKLEEQ